MRFEKIGNIKAAWYEGAPLTSEREAIEVIGETYGQDVDLVVLPAELLPDDFFWLSTGIAGAVLQKFQNYGFRVAIVGDFVRFTTESPSLRDFVHESNMRGQTLFLADRAELEARL